MPAVAQPSVHPSDHAVDPGCASPAVRYRRAAIRVFKTAGLVSFQLLGLWSLNLAGASAVRLLAVPIPGNLAGLLLLYALLSSGLVKTDWFDLTGSFLVRHLAFFFVPIAVGVIDAGRLLARHGIGIVLTLVVSATAGILLSGLVCQIVAGRKCTGRERS